MNFQDWLLKARKGDSYVYFIGDLAYERGKSIPGKKNDRLEQADIAWNMSARTMANCGETYIENENPIITLVQRRKGNGVYDYIAQKL